MGSLTLIPKSAALTKLKTKPKITASRINTLNINYHYSKAGFSATKPLIMLYKFESPSPPRLPKLANNLLNKSSPMLCALKLEVKISDIEYS